MKFTQVASNAFQKLQINAGVLLTEFTPASGTLDKTKIFAATSGGTTFTAAPEMVDFGEDIDNVPANTKQLARIDYYTVTLSGTAKTADTTTAKWLVGAADVATDKITPRSDIELTDFHDIWLVGDYGSVNTGNDAGYIAIRLIDAFNTGGFSIQTNDKGKADFAFEFTAFYDIEDIDTVPFEIYVHTGSTTQSN